MDITFGTIPMIVLVFKGYCQVRNFATEYNTFNKQLRSVLRDISITASIFKDAVNTLLAEVIEEDTREIMLEDLEDEHWKEGDLNALLECLLGGCFETVRDSIFRTQETLQEIRKLLLILSGNATSSRTKFPFERLAKGVALVATAVLKTDPFQLQFKNIQIKSPRKKLLSLAKDYRGDLERLRNELRENNKEFLAMLQLAPYRRLSKRAQQSSRIQRLPMTKEGSGSSDREMMGSHLSCKEVQIASQRLYRMITPYLCQCHLTHLRLDGRIVEKSIPKSLKGKSTQSPQLAVSDNYSFRLTAKSPTGSKQHPPSTTQSISFVLSNTHIEGANSKPSATPTAICRELFSSGEGYEKHFCDHKTSGNSGFILRRVPCPKATTITFSSAQQTSLADLVSSRPGDLRTFDRFLISVNLAYAVIHYYSLPWVASWSLEKIHYFEQQNPKPSVGHWIPYLSLELNHDLRQFGVKNREIHSLGLILLQLGRRCQLEVTQGDDEERMLEIALEDLCREMGPKYRDFVRSCLYPWSERGMDLMKDENLKGFLSHVDVLEEQARFFGSN